METGHLRLYMVIYTPLGDKRVRLHTYYNVESCEEAEINNQFRANNPSLKNAVIYSEFCYRVKSTWADEAEASQHEKPLCN
jgi:hypothetical protein